MTWKIAVANVMPTFTTRSGRLLLFFLVIAGGISLVGSNLLRFEVLAPSHGQLSLSHLMDAVLLAVLVFMHIFYMLTVVNENILREVRFPTSRPDFYRRYLTMGLCLAYATPLLVYLAGVFARSIMGSGTPLYSDLGPSGKLSKFIALSLFLMVYVSWLYVDLVERRIIKVSKERAYEHVIRNINIWITIELFSILLILYGLYKLFTSPPLCPLPDRSLCLGLLERWDVFGNRASLIEEKDVFVALCFGFFLARNSLHDSMPPTEAYPSQYISYMNACRTHRVRTEIAADCIKKLRDFFSRGSTLDFGCGDGQRFRQLLRYGLHFSEESVNNLSVTGVDRNAAWSSHYQFGSNNQSFEVAVPEGRRYTVVHLSHVLYEPQAVKAALNVIASHATDDAIIIVRGSSPNTPFYLLSVAIAGNLIGYHPHHHWVELHLARFVELAGLERWAASKKGVSLRHSADMTIAQLLDIQNEEALAALLGIIFSTGSREFAREVLGSLKSSGIKQISNDDSIWIFKRATAQNSEAST